MHALLLIRKCVEFNKALAVHRFYGLVLCFFGFYYFMWRAGMTETRFLFVCFFKYISIRFKCIFIQLNRPIVHENLFLDTEMTFSIEIQRFFQSFDPISDMPHNKICV